MVQLDDSLPTDGGTDRWTALSAHHCLSIRWATALPMPSATAAAGPWAPSPHSSPPGRRLSTGKRARRSGGTIKAALGGRAGKVVACLVGLVGRPGQDDHDGASDLLVGPTAGRRVSVELWQQNRVRESRSQLPIKSDTAERPETVNCATAYINNT